MIIVTGEQSVCYRELCVVCFVKTGVTDTGRLNAKGCHSVVSVALLKSPSIYCYHMNS